MKNEQIKIITRMLKDFTRIGVPLHLALRAIADYLEKKKHEDTRNKNTLS